MSVTGIGIDDAHVALDAATDDDLEGAAAAIAAEVLSRLNAAKSAETVAALLVIRDGDAEADPPIEALANVTAEEIGIEADPVDGAWARLHFPKIATSAPGTDTFRFWAGVPLTFDESTDTPSASRVDGDPTRLRASAGDAAKILRRMDSWLVPAPA